MSFTLAIVGRPNVGKSTLFNRLVGKRLALVDDQPGVTRDLREGEARLGDLRFTVVDTAGLEEADDHSLPGRMRALTERAVASSDICLFVTDARDGLVPADYTFADLLRRSGATVILGVNKAEGRAGESGVLDAYSLGLGDPIGLSAEHGEGMAELYAAILPHADRLQAEADAEAFDTTTEDDPLAEHRPIQIAVIGRPNAGKSTLVNQILGEDRMLTGPEAGITRDSIAVTSEWGGRSYRIFDTAGIRKRAKVQQKLEKLSVGDALRAVRFAEVVIVVMDGETAFETQDLKIIDLAEREGRAVVLAINKWDLEDEKNARVKELREKCERLLPQVRGIPMVTVSALTGRGLNRLSEAVEKTHGVWNRRVTTSKLNEWLQAATQQHPPPAPGGRRIKMRYMTQVKARPPSFVVMCARADEVADSYQRYLVNGLRADFDLPGVPVRLMLRSGENPYDKKK